MLDEGADERKERSSWRFDVKLKLGRWECRHIYVHAMSEDMAYRLGEYVVHHLFRNVPIRRQVEEFAVVTIMDGVVCRQHAHTPTPGAPLPRSFLVVRVTKENVPPLASAATTSDPTAASGAWKLRGRGVQTPVPWPGMGLPRSPLAIGAQAATGVRSTRTKDGTENEGTHTLPPAPWRISIHDLEQREDVISTYKAVIGTSDHLVLVVLRTKHKNEEIPTCTDEGLRLHWYRVMTSNSRHGDAQRFTTSPPPKPSWLPNALSMAQKWFATHSNLRTLRACVRRGQWTLYAGVTAKGAVPLGEALFPSFLTVPVDDGTVDVPVHVCAGWFTVCTNKSRFRNVRPVQASCAITIDTQLDSYQTLGGFLQDSEKRIVGVTTGHTWPRIRAEDAIIRAEDDKRAEDETKAEVAVMHSSNYANLCLRANLVFGDDGKTRVDWLADKHSSWEAVSTELERYTTNGDACHIEQPRQIGTVRTSTVENIGIAEELHRGMCAGDNEYAVDVGIISLSPTEGVSRTNCNDVFVKFWRDGDRGTVNLSSVVSADTISGWTKPVLVCKCGVTTGWTTGLVWADQESLWTCRDINGRVVKGLLGVHGSRRSVLFSRDGDSGAFVVLATAADQLLGMLSGRVRGDPVSLISIAAVWAPHFGLTPVS